MTHRLVRHLVLALAILAGATFTGGCDKGSTTPANTALSGPGKDSTTATVKTPDNEKALTHETASAKADFTLTSEQLAKAFEIDKDATDQKYRDKWLEIEGSVNDVNLDGDGNVWVDVNGYVNPKRNSLERRLYCRFAPVSMKKVNNLTPGQSIKFKGRYQGDKGLSYLEMSKCEIISLGPDPVVTVSSDQLSMEYAKDEAAADAKYKYKWLTIECAVIELKKDKEGVHRPLLGGVGERDAKPIPIAVFYEWHRSDEFAALKKGDKVKIKGNCMGRISGTIQIWLARLMK